LRTALTLAALLATSAAAHSHSWYEPSCCSGYDCAPVDDVRMTRSGWYVESTGETIPYGDDRERPSRDGQFHRCAPPGEKTRCLYVPANS